MTRLTIKHLICVTLVLSIAVSSQQQFGVLGFYIEPQGFSADIVAVAAVTPTTPSSILSNEEISLLDPLNANQHITDVPHNDAQNDFRNQPNFLIIWPSLRELLWTPTDYDDLNMNLYNNENLMENTASKELNNLRFMQKLRLLSQTDADIQNKRENEPSMPEIVPNSIKLNNNNEPFIDGTIDLSPLDLKQHGVKKNAQWPLKNSIVRKAVRKQYMSPCHFKICNMGRKRHARY